MLACARKSIDKAKKGASYHTKGHMICIDESIIFYA